MSDESEIAIRFLEANEAEILVDLIRDAYGDSYDAEWVYQPEVISERISGNTLRSAVGQLADGTILGHMALMVEESAERVLHAGVAVVRDAARGHHLFERLKRFSAQWATEAGYLGIFSEATAAHPYSQKANIALGAHETGFLLGWIPASVANNAASDSAQHRQSVALFYLKLNEGPLRPIFAPNKYAEILANIIGESGLHCYLESADVATSIVEHSEFDVESKDDHNLSVIHVTTVGADLVDSVNIELKRQLHEFDRDAVYVDVPLQSPATQLIMNSQGDQLEFGFAGIFPNRDRNGDVLRLQAFADIDLHVSDIAIASDHGRELLDFVIADGWNS
jgi:serine/threonine-protein kinase RsbW